MLNLIFLRPSGICAFFASIAVFLFATGLRCSGTETIDSPQDTRPVYGIMDNSFLVEEAYNQDKGVVQDILMTVYSRESIHSAEDSDWALAFTQEWPVFSEAHQLSYTIPYSFLREGGSSRNGLGDIFLNYRYQAYYSPKSLTALAPRASIILPTGDKDSGFTEDTVGMQFALPFSTTFGDRWFMHLNAGLTYLPNAASAQDRDLLDYNLGASIIYAHTTTLHFLLEWVGYWNQSGEPGLPKSRELTSLISPGVRKAFNFANQAQLVIGIAAPIGLTRASPDIGCLLYVSFEHFFSREE
jgi:hypothetical protein